jgi:Gluconate 2-dehydrogenase subunit 3
MKRRRFFQTLAAAGTIPTLAGQPQQAQTGLPKLETTIADSAADTLPHFFTAQQFAALRKLCDVLQPPINGTPGALDAKAPEFLDFLIGESPADRQQLYRQGLNALNQAGFVEADAARTIAILAPLHAPWTFDPPPDPLAAFLQAARQDVRTATVNSREYNAAGGGSRRFGGQGYYWLPLDTL